ncbi:MAG: RrF2 family transcriptional regulator [Bryobacteraceae bacterium]
MQLTRGADYGVRAMIYLASLPLRTRVSSPELAKATDTTEAFLAKVLQRLVQARLIESFRGQGGGFALRVTAREISLLDVIEAIDGPIALNLCTTHSVTPGQTCERKEWCAAHLVWARAQSSLREILGSASLEALAEETARGMTSLAEVTP